MKTNTIPTPLQALGSFWRQPSKDEILTDDDNAIMSEETFRELKLLPNTLPAVTCLGKMWRGNLEGKDVLYWCGIGSRPGTTSIQMREIIIL